MLVADFVLMRTMLPAKSRSSLNLQDVFRSAEASVLGEQNVLDLPKATSAIVLMIDGLGFVNLQQHARGFLFSQLTDRDFASCGFPSTTASSITSFATASNPSDHGLFGYSIFNRSTSENVNLLSGLDKFSILEYLKVAPISEKSQAKVHAVTLKDYEDSGFTRATMNGAKHHFAEQISERLELAREIVATQPGSLVYVYLPELDKQAHRTGVSSSAWGELLDHVDQSVQMLVAKLPSDVGLLVTADHGVVDIDLGRHLFLEDLADFGDDLLSVCGDPRATYVYLAESADKGPIREELAKNLAERAAVVTPPELVELGYWQPSLLEDDDLLPDFVVVATADVAIFHRKFSNAASQKMVGHHGAVSEAETKVPLLRFGTYSSSLLVP